MSEPFFRDALDQPLELGFEPIVIEAPDTAPPPLPPAEPDPPGPVVGRWFGPRQNGRLATPLPEGEWKVEWSTPISVGRPPHGLQHTGDRVLLRSHAQWELFDAASGRALADGPIGPSELLADPELGLFYAQQFPGGAFEGAQLSDGKRAFRTVFGWGSDLQRSYLGRLPGNCLVTVGGHRKVNPHQPQQELSCLEVWFLGDPIEADSAKILTTRKRRAVLQHGSLGLVTAQSGETLVIGTEDGFHLLDASLTPTASLTGKFTPIWISLDEAGRIHAIVNDVNGTQCYWHLTPDGEHLGLVAVPRSEGEVLAPPVLGYDHTAYVLTSLMVRAFDAAGELQWESDLGGRLGGAAVSGDDRLLVAAGNAISTFTVTGEGEERTIERAPLIELEGETLATAPLLTADGKLLVASTTSLFCCSV